MNDDLSNCPICMGRKRVLVGMSYPPNRTIEVKCEYEPCPNCQPGPHSFFARRFMQIRKDMLHRSLPAPPQEPQE